ncbi:hypothetical protein [Erwinia amylovora]|uniref:hypothetical protein n=1 Tax=Erwinia amylovora TaxID=552 RepID=UPI0020C0FE79|nr:hypothetical protein [Erwinia amylovora]MCK8417642.1 hypothetical protein [Erwinia amylovora]
MPSVTAQFLFAGFSQYLTKQQNADEVVNVNFNGGGLIESAYLLESIAAAADIYVLGRQKEFPGVWEYEVVEPFGWTLAEWAKKGEAQSLSDKTQALFTLTDEWIKNAGLPS